MTATPDVETPTEAEAALRDEGYSSELSLRDGALWCSACDDSHQAEDAEVERVFRFEGTSDPGDEMLVAGLRCPRCGAHGVLASAFGASADPALAHLAGQAGPAPST